MAKLKKALRVIDVSEHNGKIDWERIKNDGIIEGAIIRCGFGTEGIDKTYKYNVSECIRLGIPFGLYHYSYIGYEMKKMTNENERMKLVMEQGVSEAEFFWNLIAPYEHYLTFPVFMDVEDDWSLSLSGKELHFGIQEYVHYLQGKNVIVGLYASQYQIEGKLNWSDVQNSNIHSILGEVELWCASWTKNEGKVLPEEVLSENCPSLGISGIAGIKIKPAIWQYTNVGVVNGTKGSTDISYIYTDYEQLKETSGLNGGWADGIDLKPNIKGLVPIYGSNYTTQYFEFKKPFYIFRNEDGSLFRGLKEIDGNTYCFSNNLGAIKTGQEFIGSDVYFFRADNYKMLKSQWLKLTDDIGDYYKFFLPNGKMASFNMFKINGKEVIFAPDGSVVPKEQAPFITWGTEYGDKNIICEGEPYDPFIDAEEPELPVEDIKPIEPPVDPIEPPVEPPVEPNEPIIPPVEPSEPTDTETSDNAIVKLLKNIILAIIDLFKKLFKK